MNRTGVLVAFVTGAALLLVPSPIRSQAIDELHKKALGEGGSLNFYSALLLFPPLPAPH